MKKLLVAACIICAVALVAQAQDGDTKKKPTPSAEQKALHKEMLDKYDTNKDGKLDKEERSKMSADDKAKLEKAGMGPKKKKTQ